MSDKVDLRVDWCSYEAAKYAVEKWHYSGCMPRGSQCYLGVWENAKFIGVVVIGRSISPNIGTSYNLTQHECAELTRVALSKHNASVSRILSVCISKIKKEYPGLRLLISFADSEQGHAGTIYQAANWLFVGNSVVTQHLVNGKWRNDTHVNRFVGRGELAKRKAPPKHKYLYPLDRAMRKQIAPLAQPYPKRVSCGLGVESDTVGDQPTGAGATPAARSEV